MAQGPGAAPSVGRPNPEPRGIVVPWLKMSCRALTLGRAGDHRGRGAFTPVCRSLPRAPRPVLLQVLPPGLGRMVSGRPCHRGGSTTPRRRRASSSSSSAPAAAQRPGLRLSAGVRRYGPRRLQQGRVARRLAAGQSRAVGPRRRPEVPDGPVALEPPGAGQHPGQRPPAAR